MRRRQAAALAALALGAGLWASRRGGEATSGARLPGPAPWHGEGRSNEPCEGCHAEIAAEWRGSEHHTAFTDPVFQRAYGVEPLPFCRRCHAPEGEGAAEALGVACITCHQAGPRVAAAPGAARAAGRAPHPVERLPGFEAAAACAGCHEFLFDDSDRRDEPLWMQRTATEHRRSGHGERSCASCHMPEAGGHRSHAFASTRGPAALRRAVRVGAERRGESGLRVRIELEGVGHAFPTGDLFRRLAVVVEAVGPEHRVVAGQTRYLQRHFAPRRQSDGAMRRVEVGDDRPGARGELASEIDLELGPSARGRELRWSVTLQRVLHVTPGREAEATLAGEVELASGALASR